VTEIAVRANVTPIDRRKVIAPPNFFTR